MYVQEMLIAAIPAVLGLLAQDVMSKVKGKKRAGQQHHCGLVSIIPCRLLHVNRLTTTIPPLGGYPVQATLAS
jgi:hypothetical protein